MFLLILVFLFSFLVTFFGFHLVIPYLKKAGITGKNMNSEKQEEIPEMGGLIIAVGFGAGMILIIFLRTFFDVFLSISLSSFLAVLSTVLIVVIIGVFDDLISLRQIVKAIIPVFSSLPLVALKEGYSLMKFPLVGWVNFGILYPLVLIPLGITGATNAVNMLAGFNGLEVGMGIVAMSSLAIIAYTHRIISALLILMAALGPLVAALFYNWYPAKVFIGDVGTLSIGAIIACTVIVGNYETAGVILIIPYVIDFCIKAKHKFPYSFGIYKEGKLYCPDNGPVGLAQWIMKISGGIKERDLVLVLMGIEAICGIIAISLY